MLVSFPDHCSPHMYGGGEVWRRGYSECWYHSQTTALHICMGGGGWGKSGDEATVNAGIIPRPLLSTYVWGGVWGKSGDKATVNAGIIPRPLLSTYVWGGGGGGGGVWGKSGDEATVNAGIIPRPLLSTYVVVFHFVFNLCIHLSIHT